jgi:hypothetical protein
LAAALQLAQHGLAHEPLAVARDEGLDREPALRGGCDHRKVAQAFKRHAERAWYRRRGQRQHVDFGAQRFQTLLLAHAETVLLVDDHEPELLELDVLLQKLVGSDHDIDRPRSERRERRGDVLLRAKARQLGDFHRPVREAVGERVEVLLREQRGGNEHRHLLAVVDRDERRAERDLGLAESHVAADQAVHRLALAEVV